MTDAPMCRFLMMIHPQPFPVWVLPVFWVFYPRTTHTDVHWTAHFSRSLLNQKSSCVTTTPSSKTHLPFIYLFFLQYSNSGPCASVLPLELCSQPFSALLYFSNSLLLFVWGSLDHDPPTYVFCIAGVADVDHHAWLIC
jgi:hypothetical protein